MVPALRWIWRDPLEGVECVDNAHIGERQRATDDRNPGYHMRDKREIGNHQDTLYCSDNPCEDVSVR